MPRQATDQLYIEVDYFTPNGYYVYTAEANINAGSLFTPSVSVNITVNSFAVLDTQATMTTVATVIGSAQADLSAEATLSADAGRIQQAQSAVTATATVTAQVGKAQSGAAALSASSTVFAIGYLRYQRPLQVAYSFGGFSDSVKKFGTHSFVTGGNRVEYYCSGKAIALSGGPTYWAVEFWVYPRTGLTGNNSLIAQYTDGTIDYWTVFWQFPGRIALSHRTTLDTYSTNYTNVTMSMDQWHHVAIVYNPQTSPGIRIYIDGTDANTGGSLSPKQNASDQGLLQIGGYIPTTLFGGNPGAWNGYIDEFRVLASRAADTLSTIGDATSSSTITVPTDRRYNDSSYTQYLGHLDGDFVDDISEFEIAAATLTSSATLSATAQIVKIASADLTATATVTAEGELLPFEASAALTAETTATATGQTTKQGIADLTAAAAQTATAVKTVSVDIDTDSIATQLTAAAKIGDFLIAADAAFTQTTVAQATISVLSDQSSQFTETVTGVTTRSAQASLSTTSVQTCFAERSRAISSSISASAIFSLTGNNIKQFASDLAAEFTQVAQGKKASDESASLSAEFQTTATVSVFRTTPAQLASEFTQTATAIKSVIATGTLANEFAQTTDADRIRNVRIGYIGDRIAKTISTYGNVEISTAQSKFGSGSALITDTGDYFTVPGDSSLYNGDFTVEMWLYASNLTSIPNGNIWDNRTSSTSGMYLYVSYGSIGLGEGINIKGLTSAGFNNSQWNHIALVRNSTNAKVFVNGVQKISATVTTTNYSNRTSYIGSTYTGSTPMRSYFDEVRLSSSVRYTTGFTPSTAAFTSDVDVRALLHLDTDFSDDIGYAPGLEAFVSTLTAAAKIGDFLIAADVVSSLTAVAQVGSEGAIDIIAVSSQTATVDRVRSTQIDLTAQATVTAAGTKGSDDSAALTSQFTQTVQAVKTVSAIAAVTATAATTVIADRFAEVESTLQSTAEQITVISKTVSGESTPTAVSTLTILAGNIIDGAAALTGFYSQLTAGDVIHITEELTWTIPREIRQYQILREDREWQIREESRIYTIGV